MIRSIFVVVAALVFSPLPSFAFGQKTAEKTVKELIATEFDCSVTSAQSMANGEVEAVLNPKKARMKTVNQDGDAENDTAKCFNVNLLDKKGKARSLGFSCLPLNSDTVKEFNSDSLRITGEYSQELQINFRSGKGSFSYEYRGCDWGANCAHEAGSAEFTECKVR